MKETNSESASKTRAGTRKFIQKDLTETANKFRMSFYNDQTTRATKEFKKRNKIVRT